jgi:myo-inositol-hexaphosphate 3-phosphohydrolase
MRVTLTLVVLLSSGAASPPVAAQVIPTVETAPVPSSGDAADDAAIWVHPLDRAQSTVIATDKDAGLAVYDLSGNLLQFLPDGELNNVDLRDGFPLGGAGVTLVTSGERGANVLAVYAVDPRTRQLRSVAARTIPLGIDVYGCCMYRSRTSGDTFFIGTSEEGVVEQWRLFDDGTGGVDALRVRSFDVGGTVEGCVADDEAGHLFLGEEEEGIWRYGAEPDAGAARVQVDTTGTGGHLSADVEGLALYDAGGGAGYLLASSQGNSTYVVYDRRPPHAHRLTFRIGSNAGLGIDAVSGTDGIEVTSAALGSAFTGGLFVAQDDSNPGANQNFKLVPWSAIASVASPPLISASPRETPGVECLEGTWAYRNGSGINPFVLVGRDPPRLGSAWEVDLDCSAHGPGPAYLFAFGRRATGPVLAFGEALVDPASPLLLLLGAPHAGSTIRFVAPFPPDARLCGLRAAVQGLCFGAPRPRLSNAIDLRVGL